MSNWANNHHVLPQNAAVRFIWASISSELCNSIRYSKAVRFADSVLGWPRHWTPELSEKERERFSSGICSEKLWISKSAIRQRRRALGLTALDSLESKDLQLNYSGSFLDGKSGRIFAVFFSWIAQKQTTTILRTYHNFGTIFEGTKQEEKTREGRSEMRREASSEKALNSVDSTWTVQLVQCGLCRTGSIPVCWTISDLCTPGSLPGLS